MLSYRLLVTIAYVLIACVYCPQGVRIVDAALARVLRPDLAPAQPPAAAAAANGQAALGNGGPPRGTRAIADDPYVYDAALRMGVVLLQAFTDRFLTTGQTVSVPDAVPPVQHTLLCGPPLSALLSACLAGLAFYDRAVVPGACAFLRSVLTMATEPPAIPHHRGGSGRHGVDDDVGDGGEGYGYYHHHRGGGEGGRDPRIGRGAQQQQAAAEAARNAQAELQRRHSAIMAVLRAPVHLPPTAFAVVGHNQLALPGAPPGDITAAPLAERLYKRLIGATLKDFPADAIARNDTSAVSIGGVLQLLHKLFPPLGGGGGGGSVALWLSQVCSDPSVVRPAILAPPRLQELAGALLQPGLTASMFSTALHDFSEACRGRDSGRPAINPAALAQQQNDGPGFREAGQHRYGAAAEDDSDEED